MSFNETGHYKNITALAAMKEKALSYGPEYNPSKVTIKLPGLNTLHSTANADNLAVINAGNAFNNAVNDRLTAFAPLKMLCTQVLAAFKVSPNADSEKIKDLTSINKKIQGIRISKKNNTPIVPGAPPADFVSSSQQSFDMKLDNFTKFVDLITTEPGYAPNESEIKLLALQAYRSSLEAANNLVLSSYQAVNSARIKRDKTLYGTGASLFNVQSEVKQYVKSVYTASGIKYKQMAAIKFTKPAKLFI